MKKAIGVLALGGMMAAGAMADTWTGFVSDAMCGAKHTGASEKDAKCAQSCVKRGSDAVLVTDGKVVKFTADSKDKISELVGKKVTVTGSMEGGSLKVEEAKAAE